MIDTTQTYARQAGEFKPEQVAIHGPYRAEKRSSGQLEFWTCIVIVFFVGFAIGRFWG